jgi:hypothetical protein
MVIDNYDLFEMHDREQEARLQELPTCKCCGFAIQQEQAICIDGKWFCEDCEDEAWELIRKEYLEDVA